MRFWLLGFFLALTAEGFAQVESMYADFPDEWHPRWLNMQGAFLEPNRFATVYDRTPERLRLEAGYGNEILSYRRSSFGAEILIWSGLKTLDNFRFPVETADYFFGIYSIFLLRNSLFSEEIKLRTRLSHISSHLVDGAQDSVIGGSSSKFSREFVSLEALLDRYESKHYAVSAGVKYVFHQVNKFETALQFPVVFDYRFLHFNRRTFVSAFLSTAAGPSLPAFSGGLVFHHEGRDQQGMEFYGEYHHGHSRYGIDGDKNEKGFEIGIRLSKFPER